VIVNPAYEIGSLLVLPAFAVIAIRWFSLPARPIVLRSAQPEHNEGEITRYLVELAWAPDAIMQDAQLHCRMLDPETLSVV